MEEEKGMTRGQSGEVRQREAAPAIVDLKPHSCLWLILPESGGGAKGPMVSKGNVECALQGSWSNVFKEKHEYMKICIINVMMKNVSINS